MQTRGYSAMSFQDIALKVGIRKPSIVHHFPSKHALGEAVVRRYRETFAAVLAAVEADPDKTAWDALEIYFGPYLEYAGTPDTVCLCGALAGEAMALPPEMRHELALFFDGHERWLEGILRRGERAGQFRLSDRPEAMARFLFCALQGALLAKRATGDLKQLTDVLDTIRATLRRNVAKGEG